MILWRIAKGTSDPIPVAEALEGENAYGVTTCPGCGEIEQVTFRTFTQDGDRLDLQMPYDELLQMLAYIEQVKAMEERKATGAKNQ